MSGRVQIWFQAQVEESRTKRARALKWLEDTSPVIEDPGGRDGDPECRYSIGEKTELWGTGEDSDYHALAFPALLTQYLQAFDKTGWYWVDAVCSDDNGSESVGYLITAEGHRSFEYRLLQAVVLTNKTSPWKRFFRESCCVVCEYDVLNEGGQHAPDCPVGILLGSAGAFWRHFLTLP